MEAGADQISGHDTRTIEVPVKGMDCADCARAVEHAISRLDRVRSAEVLLSAEKAIVTVESTADLPMNAIRRAVESAGYTVPSTDADPAHGDTSGAIGRRVLWLFGVVFTVVLLVVVAGEWLGLIESVTDGVPLGVGTFVVLLLGYPVFKQVARSALRGRIISHTLMAVGALAALIAGEWATAVVVVFFMRVGDYAERFTTERARASVRSLTRMAPRKARVVRNGEEEEKSIEDIKPDDVVVVRPGERIPVDGEVVSGRATINQSAITGESMPVDVEPGTRVYAATIAELGALRVRTAAVGHDTTFGRVIRMVEEAEAHRGEIQRAADRFSAYYLPVVLLVAVSVFLFRQDVMATVAVLVVACSCAFALATPVAILASVGAAARRGLLIKGGKYLELLERADVVLIDKTGTLTLGRPRITDIVAVDGFSEDEVLRLAASAERYSEHPLGAAVRSAARDRGLTTSDPEEFEAFPGMGIRAVIEGREVIIGRARPAADYSGSRTIEHLVSAGKTLLSLQMDGREVGVLAAADSERAEVPEAIDALRRSGLQRLELLTGDNEMVARAIAGPLGLPYRAGLLPDDKIEIVRRYQEEGHTVVMIGDGVNDAPALAQADVGIAMGAAGADVAIEVAHIAVMRDDWLLIPDLFTISRRTMRVVRLNIGFTALYNLAGLTLAALGFLPPILAAAAQSLPDLGILANSARLLRQ